MQSTYLYETAWEVCNQVGGIYTVIRSKAAFLTKDWGADFCMIGPYLHKQMPSEFDVVDDADDPNSRAVAALREMGIEAYYGIWLVTGRPKVVLINPRSLSHRLMDIKMRYHKEHGIPNSPAEKLVDDVFLFAEVVTLFFTKMFEIDRHQKQMQPKVIAHFHEWMVGLPILDLKNSGWPVKTVFTTHATMLGRYLAGSSSNFYDELQFVNWKDKAREFMIEPQVVIERLAAQKSTIFTTVSEVTAMECRFLLGRKPDKITPNGLNIDRFTALHHFENMHKRFKDAINQFVIGHFFHSYSFDLDNTLYFFTSGRYEFKNKGFDMCIDALAELNQRLKEEKSEITVVMFFVTKQPFHSFNPLVLHSRAMMQEIKLTCDEITKNIGDQLFESVVSDVQSKLPDTNQFVDEYWKLRLRRTMQAWKSNSLPLIVTHNLQDDMRDELLNAIRAKQLFNYPEDRVKIIYHPDFINTTNPLFGMDYGQFIRGCNLGVFPSYYEPWGYTPHECVVSGIPSVTSDLSGFGQYTLQNIPDRNEKGVFVVRRKDNTYPHAVRQLTNIMYDYTQIPKRDRIVQRSQLQSIAPWFDWQTLMETYRDAYALTERS